MPAFPLLLVAALLLACASEPVPADGLMLEVRSPLAGVVSVERRSAEVSALSPATLGGLGDGPYDVTLDTGERRYTWLDLPGPVVDLSFAFEAPPVVRDGPLVELTVALLPPTAQVAALDGRQRLPITLTDGGARIFAPSARPLTLIAWWPTTRSLTVRTLAEPALAVGRTLSLGPEQRPSHTLQVSLAGGDAAWLSAELTWEGLATGLLLAEGLAFPGEALAAPAFDDAALGIWLGATVRAPGQASPTLAVKAHVPASTTEVRLTRPPSLASLSPLPAADPLNAPQLRRDVATLTSLEPLDGWLTLTLTGTDGCDERPWTVLGTPASLAERLPQPVFRDPLASPLLYATLTHTRLRGISFEAAFGADPPNPINIPGLSPSMTQLTVLGFYQSQRRCEVSPDLGRYTRHTDTCAAGEPAPEVLVDRCGQVISLSAAPLCGALDVEVAVTRDADGLTLQTAEGVTRLAPQVEPRGVELDRTVRGDWFWFERQEQPYRLVDGEPTQALGPPIRRAAGTAEGGPWLRVSAAGELLLPPSLAAFSGTVVEFDGRQGRALAKPRACQGEPEELSLLLGDDTLTLTQRETIDESSVRLKRLILRRR